MCKFFRNLFLFVFVAFVSMASFSFVGSAIAAEWDYESVSFDTAASGNAAPFGITYYQDFFWIVDLSDSDVYKYDPDGTYTGTSFDTAAAGATVPIGITGYDGFLWVVQNGGTVYKFETDGTYTGTSFSTTGSGNAAPFGLLAYNDFFWITDFSDDEVYKYGPTGTYTGTSFDTSAVLTGVSRGLTQAGGFFWIVEYVGSGTARVYKFETDGTYTGTSYSIGDSSANGDKDITFDGIFFWVMDAGDAEVYKFEGPDATPPSVSYFNPADGATGVAVDATFEIAFDEDIATSSGNVTIKKSSDNSTVETIDVTGSKVTASSTTALLINPSTTLDDDTAYYIQIDATAIDDTAGNSYAGISDGTTWNFTTVDLTAPTISSFSPADDATGVARSANLVLTFSEAVDVETGNITIKRKNDDSTFETIDVTGSLVTGTGTDTITINPASDFEEGEGYYVHIDGSAFDDAAGNSYAGISNKTTWNFAVSESTGGGGGGGGYTGVPKGDDDDDDTDDTNQETPGLDTSTARLTTVLSKLATHFQTLQANNQPLPSWAREVLILLIALLQH